MYPFSEGLVCDTSNIIPHGTRELQIRYMFSEHSADHGCLVYYRTTSIHPQLLRATDMLRKWSRERIKSAIIGLHLSGDSLSYSSMVADERALLQAATRYFGTWEAAVVATGINYDSYRRHRKRNPDTLLRAADSGLSRSRLRRNRPRSLYVG